jgi:hypothetical protein
VGGLGVPLLAALGWSLGCEGGSNPDVVGWLVDGSDGGVFRVVRGLVVVCPLGEDWCLVGVVFVLVASLTVAWPFTGPARGDWYVTNSTVLKLWMCFMPMAFLGRWTAFVAQNGVEIHQGAKATSTGCPKAKTKPKATKKTKTKKQS